MYVIFFYTPVNREREDESVCRDCGYRDKIGGFKKTNQAISRENKINQILD